MGTVMYTRHLLFATVLSATSATAAAAEDWPMWRGPAQNGISADRALPLNWSATENVAWKLAMPTVSGSTPIVSGNTVFLSVAEGANEGDPLALWAVDRASGKVRWKQPMGAGNRKVRKGDMTSPSPVTDGKTVWLLTGTGVLKAFDFAGKELWARDITKDYGAWGLNHGYGSSPLLDGGALYIPVLHGMNTDDPSYVLKVDAKTGKTLWKVERPTTAQRESPDAYTTPVIAKVGSAQEIVISGGDVVTGHDPASGKELWRLNGQNPENNPFYRVVASPVAHGDLVFAPSRVKPLTAVKAGGRGDVSSTHKLWAFDKGPDVPSPLTDGTLLYAVDDRGVVHVLEAKTGAIVYGPERLKPGTYSSSPILAGDRIYVLNEDGLTTVIKSGRQFQVLAENPLGEYVLGSAAASNGQIFIRTGQHLYCIGKPAAPARAAN
jgi:outer membrane protein assembly factor BamB